MKLLWFLVAAPLFGQYLPNVPFSNLVTTRDGQTLYFSSPASLRGDNEFPFQKIFRIDPAGVHLAVQLDRVETFGGPNFTTFYLAIEPDVSADGSVFSHVARRTCQGGSSCAFAELYQSHVTARGSEIQYSGRTRLSRDGRYALRYGSTGIVFPSDPVPALIDLATGEHTPVPGRIPEGRQVASGGTVLTFSGVSWILWNKAGSRAVAIANPVSRALLSDNAALIAYESPLPSNERQLFLYDVASRDTTLVDQGLNDFDASLSDDGRLVCYLRDSQVILYDRNTASRLLLPAIPEGVREAVLSGDGSTVWEATTLGRIVRMDAGSGDAQQVIPRTPWIAQVDGAPVPGSLNWARGSGLSFASASPLPPLPEFIPEFDGGVGVIVGSTPAKLRRISPTEIQYQIPFEMPPGTYRLSLLPNDSPFDQPLSITVVPYSPKPATSLSGETVIAHANFSALINDQSPAHPGEVVHIYFTGLGQVSPPLASGAAAPVGPLSPVQQNPACQSTPASEILFAGMAPGMVGIYQVDIRLPSQASGLTNNGNGFVLFECLDISNGFFGYAFSVPVGLSHN
jgi:uncharacterized protein (TIGR03437 family)